MYARYILVIMARFQNLAIYSSREAKFYSSREAKYSRTILPDQVPWIGLHSA